MENIQYIGLKLFSHILFMIVDITSPLTMKYTQKQKHAHIQT